MVLSKLPGTVLALPNQARYFPFRLNDSRQAAFLGSFNGHDTNLREQTCCCNKPHISFIYR